MTDRTLKTENLYSNHLILAYYLSSHEADQVTIEDGIKNRQVTTFSPKLEDYSSLLLIRCM